jgi:hypothetical protein
VPLSGQWKETLSEIDRRLNSDSPGQSVSFVGGEGRRTDAIRYKMRGLLKEREWRTEMQIEVDLKKTGVLSEVNRSIDVDSPLDLEFEQA